MAATGGMPDGEKKQEMFSIANIQSNSKIVNYVRTFMSIISGCLLGIAGFTGLYGFLSFFVLYAFVSLGLLVKMGFNPDKYLPKQTVHGFVLGGIGGQMFSCVLFWTLLYALCHIY